MGFKAEVKRIDSGIMPRDLAKILPRAHTSALAEVIESTLKTRKRSEWPRENKPRKFPYSTGESIRKFHGEAPDDSTVVIANTAMERGTYYPWYVEHRKSATKSGNQPHPVLRTLKKQRNYIRSKVIAIVEKGIRRV